MIENLLEETLDNLKRIGQGPEDVLWIIDKATQTKCSWERFAELAKDFNYDSGYGGANVNEDLIVLGEDWYLERAEYDGSEWWKYCHFVNPLEYKTEDIELDNNKIFDIKMRKYYGDNN